jgi:hypothetical protein
MAGVATINPSSGSSCAVENVTFATWPKAPGEKPARRGNRLKWAARGTYFSEREFAVVPGRHVLAAGFGVLSHPPKPLVAEKPEDT